MCLSRPQINYMSRMAHHKRAAPSKSIRKDPEGTTEPSKSRTDIVQKMKFHGRTIDLAVSDDNRRNQFLDKSQSKANKSRGEGSLHRPQTPKKSSIAKRGNKRNGVKKQVQFNVSSTLYVYQSNDEENLFYTEDEQMSLIKSTAITVRALRKTLEKFPSSEKIMKKYDSIDEADPFLLALKAGKSEAQAEEIIGVEHMIHGKEYGAKLNSAKERIPKIVVREWRILMIHQELGKRFNEKSGSNDFEEVSLILASFYSSLAKEFVLRAQRRAEYIHRLNEASIKMPPAA